MSAYAEISVHAHPDDHLPSPTVRPMKHGGTRWVEVIVAPNHRVAVFGTRQELLDWVRTLVKQAGIAMVDLCEAGGAPPEVVDAAKADVS